MADYEVHPLAAAFPMMGDEELAELAADIKANGLVHPIVLDRAGKVLVDGRNRLKACAIARVEPTFIRLDGQDPRSFIVSANLERRNLSKGQQAMLHAMAWPEPEKGGRGKKGFRDGKVSATRVSYARTVLSEAPDIAELVVLGSKSLEDAYTEAQSRRNAKISDEQQMARLQAGAPDLAELVVEGRLTLAAAVAAWNQRREQERKAIEAGRRASVSLVDFCAVAMTIAHAAELGERDLVSAEQLKRLDDAMIVLRRIHRGETQ